MQRTPSRWTAVPVFALTLVCLLASKSTAGTDLSASWSDGIRLSSDDGSLKLKIGGRLMNDWVFQQGEDALLDALGSSDKDGVFHPAVLEDGTEFRRVRMYFAGTVHTVTEFKVQLDFAGVATSAKDLYMGVKKVPGAGTIRVGHQYEPMGLSELTSSKYMTFIERAAPMAFVGSRKTGLLVTNHAGPVMWAGMISRNSNSRGAARGSGEYNVTGRVTAIAWEEKDAGRMLHVGVAASRRSPESDMVTYSARPSNHLAPKYVSATVAADAATVVGLEGALVLGSVSFQGEFLASSVNALDESDPTLDGWYAYGSWFLTGERRPYQQSLGTFSRVKPNANFDGEGGTGAWEVAARFSHIDLNDAGTIGGRLDDVTLGLNWYLNPNFRWMANYVYADLEDAGTSHAVLTRFQTDF